MITRGLGKYRTRDGKIAIVKTASASTMYGYIPGDMTRTYWRREDGKHNLYKNLDLVEKIHDEDS